MVIKKVSRLKGEITVPGDKSVSHRAVMFGSIARGTTEITGFLNGADCLSTIDCFRQMGIDISVQGDQVQVHGKGLRGLKKPSQILDAGNSGTTVRLLSGILAGQDFTSEITGDASIQKRPMQRIITPLEQMGASVSSQKDNGCVPLTIQGGNLHGIHYISKVASAQVKSCVLLAGLYADTPTSFTEPSLSRNHSELMLRHFGAQVASHGTTATILPDPCLEGRKIIVPGDISSAAYFIGAGLLTPNSEILIKNVGINPTRDGILRVIKKMGGDVTLLNSRLAGEEPVADLLVRSSELHAASIEGDLIPTLIDEIPLITVLAAYAKGTTVIRNAEELKVKESNRIDVMVDNLSRMGAKISGTKDGMIIEGGHPLHGAQIDTHLDHRIAMSFAVAGLICEGDLTLQGAECVNISYPDFYQDLYGLSE